jgi:hypothetical protein
MKLAPHARERRCDMFARYRLGILKIFIWFGWCQFFKILDSYTSAHTICSPLREQINRTGSIEPGKTN